MHIFPITVSEYDFKIVNNALMAMKTANNSILGKDFGFDSASLPLADKISDFPPCTV